MVGTRERDVCVCGCDGGWGMRGACVGRCTDWVSFRPLTDSLTYRCCFCYVYIISISAGWAGYIHQSSGGGRACPSLPLSLSVRLSRVMCLCHGASLEWSVGWLVDAIDGVPSECN